MDMWLDTQKPGTVGGRGAHRALKATLAVAVEFAHHELW